MVYLVSIRMVPPVPRGPVGKVYGDVPEARKTNVISKMTIDVVGKSKRVNKRYSY